MPDSRIWIGIAACVAALGGCSVVDTLRGRTPPVEVSTAAAAHEAALVLGYLATLEQLTEASPAKQAEIAAQARTAAELDPTTSNRLRRALVLALPAHPASDATTARSELGDLLALPERLLPGEMALATVMYKAVDARLALEDENQRLAGQAAANSNERLSAANRRLQSQADEIARLGQQLDEALAKLEAVAQLERSMAKRRPMEPTR